MRTVVSAGGRAGHRHLSNPFGASPPFRRGCHPPPEREQESRPGRESRWQAMPERTETGRAAPSEGRNTTEIRIVEEHSSQRPTLWSGLRPRTGGGTPRAIARIEVRAIGSAMWLVRCCCRHRPQRIRAPALVESRPSRSRELVPGSSLPVRPSNLGGRLKVSVRIHSLQPPAMKVGLSPPLVNTKCVQDCVRLMGTTM